MAERPKDEQEGMFSSSEKPTTNQHFSIERIYVKDSSFETKNTPQSFRAKWEPQVSLDLQTKGNLVEGDVHEVVLSVTTSVKLGEEMAFIAEVHQAGVFMIKGFVEEEFRQIIGSLCPSILFPYARESLSDLVGRGGFPPLYLAPINFEALYRQHIEQAKQKDKTETSH